MEAIPWDKFLVDLIGPYKLIRKVNYQPLVLKSLTVIDPTTVWFEIVLYNNK